MNRPKLRKSTSAATPAVPDCNNEPLVLSMTPKIEFCSPGTALPPTRYYPIYINDLARLSNLKTTPQTDKEPA